MAYLTRNQVLNCRVTEKTLNSIEKLRSNCPWASRADIVETIFQILSEDLEEKDLNRFFYYRQYYRYEKPDFFLTINKRG